MKIVRMLAFIAVMLFPGGECSAQADILLNAHSHNDYRQKFPLTEALERGFTSVEADVFLINGELVIGHTYPLTDHHRTLESLYLQPLQKIANMNHGRVFSNCDSPLILLVDIKSAALPAFKALSTLLEKFPDLISSMKNGRLVSRAVTVVISGHRPFEAIHDSSVSNIFLDRPLKASASDSSVYRMASEKYNTIIHWKGKGALPDAQAAKLTELCEKAHRQGELVRLWASPENEKVWEELLRCGVDLINTDDEQRLQRFLLARKTKVPL